MSNENENLKVPEAPKISFLKGTYIWKEKNEEKYECKMKIIKSINNNIKLPISYAYVNGEEHILKPRNVVNDPFSNENSLLIWCDLVTFEGKSNNIDDRLTFLNQMNKHQEILKEKIPKVSFVQKFVVEGDINLELVIEDFVRLCLGSNIEIDEYNVCGNTLEINTVYNQILSACDELLLSRYLFYKLSKKFKFTYKLDDKLVYIFSDKTCDSEDGQKNIESYVKNLEKSHNLIDKKLLHNEYSSKKFNYGKKLNDMVIIPESSIKLKHCYLIDQRFKSSVDPYSVIAANIMVLYNLK